MRVCSASQDLPSFPLVCISVQSSGWRAVTKAYSSRS